MDELKVVWSMILAVAIIAVSTTILMNKHNENMASMGFCKTTIVGMASSVWAKCK
jgi:hypothetical protein